MWFRYLISFIDVLMVFCLIYFMNGLSWEDNKASILGFGIMFFSYIASIALMWIQGLFWAIAKRLRHRALTPEEKERSLRWFESS